jgi:Holliday junction DNA helicase RuvB
MFGLYDDSLEGGGGLFDATMHNIRTEGQFPPVEPVKTERKSGSKVEPVDPATWNGNDLRPRSFNDITGQPKVKRLLNRYIVAVQQRGEPLDHMLFVGPSGTGKTTFAHVIAHEMGARVWQFEAPVSGDTLLELRDAMQDGDILFLDEIHQQAVADRRGRNSSTQPEVLFSVMEDRTLPTSTGVLPFPAITLIGATTDEGALPDAFINRFPVRPRFEDYTVQDMIDIGRQSALNLGSFLEWKAAVVFANASRYVPREMNNYVRNAAKLTPGRITEPLAREVLKDLVGVSEDGLTADMQGVLTFLYTRCRRETSDGEVKYQASVATLATAIGKSRDQKAVQLRVEPWLIRMGYLQVGHGGRTLTPQGAARARELLED